MSIQQRRQSLAPGVLLELFIAEIPNGPTLYFHNGDAVVTFQGNEFQPYPIKADGWEYNTTGTLPRPHLTITNIDGAISALMRQYGDLVGTLVTRKRTLFEYLDGQPGADPEQEYPPDIFTVDSKIAELPETVEFEMVSALDNENLKVPRRQIKAGACEWIFRGPDCGYTGAPKQDKDGNLVVATTDRGAYNQATTYALHDYTYTLVEGIRIYWVSLKNGNTDPLTNVASWSMTVCLKKLADCKLHFGANNPLPYEGFPGAAKLPQG